MVENVLMGYPSRLGAAKLSPNGESGDASIDWINGGTMTTRKSAAKVISMLDQIAAAIAKADGGDFQADPARYRRLALAALKPLAKPTDHMVDAAHEAVSFDDHWAINSRRDFRQAVRAMIAVTMKEGRSGV
jgi:hypothetical protein